MLAHEQQHAADHAAGLPVQPVAECLWREEAAFQRQGEIRGRFWQYRLPAPTTAVQRDLNRIVRDGWSDPVGFVLQLMETYRHQCAWRSGRAGHDRGRAGGLARGGPAGGWEQTAVAAGGQGQPAAPAWRRLRPRWLIGALTVAAPGLDAYRRLHTTWRERKAGPGEAAMPPAWRALTQLVPVHGLFRSHARMRAIRELLARPDRGALPARNFT